MRALSVSMILALFLMTGCGDTTTSRSLSGGAMGAAAGGLIGSMSGNFGTGAAIGAGVGLVGGYLDDQYKKGNIDWPQKPLNFGFLASLDSSSQNSEAAYRYWWNVYWIDGIESATDASGKQVEAADISVGYDPFGNPVVEVVDACKADKKASLWDKVKAHFHKNK
jgi:hypothetical protein